jgi:hypothetical protein
MRVLRRGKSTPHLSLAAIEYRWADYHYDRLPTPAADLVRREIEAGGFGVTIASLAIERIVGAGWVCPATKVTASDTLVHARIYRRGYD